MSDTAKNSIPAKRKPRNLGFDTIRIIAVFLLFIGGCVPPLVNAARAAGMDALVIAPLGIAEPFFVSAWDHLVKLPIPYLVMMSGFFYFSKPVSKADWVNSKTTFVKYWLFVAKWILVAVVSYLLMPSVMGDVGYIGILPWNETPLAFKIEIILQDLLCGFSTWTGFIGSAGTVWTVIALAWLTLIGSVLKPHFQNAPIRHVRQFVLVAFLVIHLSTGIRDIGTYFLSFYPNSAFWTFVSNFAFWEGICVDFSGASILTMYMLGALFAVDKELQQTVTNLSWRKTVIGVIVSLLIFFELCHYFGDYTDGVGAAMAINRYASFGWIFGGGALFVLAFKLGQALKSDHAVGRFVSKYGTDFVGGVITVHVFGQNLHTASGPCFAIYSWMLSNIHNGLLLNLVFVLYMLLYFSAVMFIVHWLRKVPFVRGLFWWDNVHIFDKERETALAETSSTN